MKRILPIIVLAQFFCTSLWFAGNAILPDIIRTFHLEPGFLAHLTSAVQFGFITGTLIFAVFTISDRFSPSQVFFVCSILAGLFNLGIILDGINASGLLLFRFFTGFFLAVIADSPLFSTLVAQNAPEASRGTALTIVNCIGFSITIVSIQFIQALSQRIDGQFVYVLLAIGPVLGLYALLYDNWHPNHIA